MLKNNYKDDVPDAGKNVIRKYNMINNADGTVSFVDVTQYSQVGDTFGANDINQIVEAIQGNIIVTVPAAKWAAGTAPYAWKQTVPVTGMTADTVVKVYPTYTGLTTAAAIEAYDAAYPLIAIEADSVTGGLTLYCVSDKPGIDLKMILEGIGG